MNRLALAKALSERTKAPKEVTLEFIDALFATITDGLKEGDKVTLGNFGTFYLVRHKDRKTSHPTNGQEVILPALTLAKFRPSTKLKEQTNKKRSV
jgi:DNA-binding protein HU-beta